MRIGYMELRTVEIVASKVPNLDTTITTSTVDHLAFVAVLRS